MKDIHSFHITLLAKWMWRHGTKSQETGEKSSKIYWRSLEGRTETSFDSWW